MPCRVDIRSRRVHLVAVLATALFPIVSRAVPKNYPTREVIVKKYWGNDYESATDFALNFLPRLAISALDSAIDSETVYKIRSTLLLDPVEKVTLRTFSNSALNVPSDFVAVGTDALTALRLPAVGYLRKTDRIKMCSTLVDYTQLWLAYIVPVRHVGWIEGSKVESVNFWNERHPLDTSDNCQPIFLRDNISDSVAVTRLKCVEKARNHAGEMFDKARHTYMLPIFNCAGEARWSLNAAGLEAPAVYNLGLGSNSFGFHDDPASENEFHNICDTHVNRWVKVFLALERGDDLRQIALPTLFDNGIATRTIDAKFFGEEFQNEFGASDDVLLQLVLSAAAGYNENNVQLLAALAPDLDQRLYDSFTINSNLSAKTEGHMEMGRMNTVLAMSAGIERAELEMLQKTHPQIINLLAKAHRYRREISQSLMDGMDRLHNRRPRRK